MFRARTILFDVKGYCFHKNEIQRFLEYFRPFFYEDFYGEGPGLAGQRRLRLGARKQPCERCQYLARQLHHDLINSTWCNTISHFTEHGAREIKGGRTFEHSGITHFLHSTVGNSTILNWCFYFLSFFPLSFPPPRMQKSRIQKTEIPPDADLSPPAAVRLRRG